VLLLLVIVYFLVSEKVIDWEGCEVHLQIDF